MDHGDETTREWCLRTGAWVHPTTLEPLSCAERQALGIPASEKMWRARHVPRTASALEYSRQLQAYLDTLNRGPAFLGLARLYRLNPLRTVIVARNHVFPRMENEGDRNRLEAALETAFARGGTELDESIFTWPLIATTLQVLSDVIGDSES